MTRAWIANPAHPHYPEQGVIAGIKLNSRGRIATVTLALSSSVFHGVRFVDVPAKDVSPIKLSE